MKDWKNILKERMSNRKVALPEFDREVFLSKKNTHDHSLKRRHRFIATFISIPAVAALLLIIILPSNTPVSLDSEETIDAIVAKVHEASDTTTFNSDVYKLPEGTSIEELILNLPGVQIQDDSIITVNGKPVYPVFLQDINIKE